MNKLSYRVVHLLIKDMKLITKLSSLAMRLLGISVNGIEKFCASIDLPRPTFHFFYDKVIHMISIVTETVYQQSMEKAKQREEG